MQGGKSLHRAGARIKGGILFPKRIPPFDPPEKGEGSPPSTPASAVGRLKSCAACGIGCLLFFVSIRFDFLLSSLLRSRCGCRSACVSAALRNFLLLWILSTLQVPTEAALLRSPRTHTKNRPRQRSVLSSVKQNKSLGVHSKI